MSNMEQAMRQLVAEMTSKELSEVPEGAVEEIVQWIAENYSGGETSIPEATTEAIGGVKRPRPSNLPQILPRQKHVPRQSQP